MSRISRLVVLVTSTAALVGATAGTAGAVTWHVSGTGAFTATAPPATLSAQTNGTSVLCPGASATGAFTAGSSVGATYSGISGVITYTGCVLAGQGIEVTCGYRFTGQTQPVATTSTTGDLDLTCGVTLASPGVKICHVEGSAHAIFHDKPAPSADTLTITTTSTMRTTGSGCIIGQNDTGHLGETTFSVTSNAGNGPHIQRTA